MEREEGRGGIQHFGQGTLAQNAFIRRMSYVHLNSYSFTSSLGGGKGGDPAFWTRDSGSECLH